ncbi:MFS transporter, partial [Bifidobacterium adolescentis]
YSGLHLVYYVSVALMIAALLINVLADRKHIKKDSAV